MAANFSELTQHLWFENKTKKTKDKFMKCHIAIIAIAALLATSGASSDEPIASDFPESSFGKEQNLTNWREVKYLRDDDLSLQNLPMADISLALNTNAKPLVDWQSLNDDSNDSSESTMDEDAQIAEAMLNPLSYLWLLFVQNDTVWYDGDTLDEIGEDKLAQNTTLIMPVLSMQLTETWKTIVRPVIPINSFETVDNLNVSIDNPGDTIGVDLSRETGLGDIVLWTAFSNQYEAPYIWGFGPTIMLDTASDDQLGTGKNSAGPMALLFHQGDKWIKGIVAQHWWSFSGSDNIKVDTDLGEIRVDRPDVNLTDLQVVVRYRYSALTNIGMAPNWRYNWETDQLNLPLGIGFDTLIKIGKVPNKVGAEIYYYVEKDDDFGPDWQLRLLFVPVISAPNWSRNAFF
jgi:hypothetical protein